MGKLVLDKLKPMVSEKIRPFIEEILDNYSGNVHSVHIVGSSLTEDYNEKTSDINSIFVLKTMDLKFIELLAPFGKKYRRKGVAAPLVMTPDYISTSLDVFPIEFADCKLIHQTVFGEDIFKDLEISMADLRQQCEREIKSKLIGLRQSYISSLGDRRMLTERFANSIAGFMPLFRGIIWLMGKERPVGKDQVISELSASTGINTDVFRKILDVKRQKRILTNDEMKTFFEEYYEATEKIGKVIDELCF
jgi:predicted nucleotidyltransferase